MQFILYVSYTPYLLKCDIPFFVITVNMIVNTTIVIKQYSLFEWSITMLQPVLRHLQALNLKKQIVEDNIQLIVAHS